MKTAFEFHLLIDKLLSLPFAASPPNPGAGLPEGYVACRVPDLASRLVVEPDACPRILPLGSDAAEPGLVLVPAVRRQGGARLLALNAAGTPLQVNGVPAPCTTVLREGDMVRWGGLCCFVTLFTFPLVGPAPPGAIGKACPVCRVPFQAASRCFTCACGVSMHYEEDGEETLQCTQIPRECPVCGRPIRLHPGYTLLPEPLEVAHDD